MAEIDQAAALRQPAATRAPGAARLAVWVMGACAALFWVWPLWRATLPLEIGFNEGWNAYHADAALGAGALYPSPDGLVANNYPPLSYYVLGALARVFGDTLYVGRALSLIATAWLGVIVYAMARQFGAGRLAAALGGLWFTATTARFFDSHVGMNEPQLLAQAIMCTGLAWFLRRQAAGRAVEPAILLMVVAGFFKHTLVAEPLVALLWLARENLRLALRAALVGSLAAIAGLFACYAAHGPDFIADMLMPRSFHLERAWKSIGRVPFVWPALVPWAIWVWLERGSPAARLSVLFVAVSYASYVVQTAGAGVADNAQFDLVFATGFGVALAFERLALDPMKSGWAARNIQLLFLAILVLRLAASTRLEFAYVLLSPDYRARGAEHAAVARAEAARIAAIAGPIACSNLVVCRMAGKPFVYDEFLVSQLIETGHKSPADIDAMMRARGIRRDIIDERAAATSLDRRHRDK